MRQEYGQPYTILDSSLSLEYSTPPMVWSAIHDPANFLYIPSKFRILFLSNTGKKLNRTGWLIVEKSFPAQEWLADFDIAYKRINQKDFGAYYAIQFRPYLP